MQVHGVVCGESFLLCHISSAEWEGMQAGLKRQGMRKKVPRGAEHISYVLTLALTHLRDKRPNESCLCLLTLALKYSRGIPTIESVPCPLVPRLYTLGKDPFVTEFQGDFLSS